MKPGTALRAMIVGAAVAVTIFGCVSKDAVAQEPAEAESGIAARVEKELDQAVDATVQVLRSRGSTTIGESEMKIIRKNVLLQMVDSEVLNILARKSGFKVSEEELDAILKERKDMFPSEAEFLLAVERASMTVDTFRDRLREQSVTNKFVDDKVKGLTVTEEEVNTEYERLKQAGSLEVPETADVAHILIRVEGSEEASWEAARESIEAARKRIVDGEDFNEVMKEVSQDPGGGVYTRVPRGRMVPAFEERMFDTAVEDVSEPFRTQFGWHILTVLAKHESGTLPLAEVSERIGENLKATKARDVIAKLVEDAKADMNIEILAEAPGDA